LKGRNNAVYRRLTVEEHKSIVHQPPKLIIPQLMRHNVKAALSLGGGDLHWVSEEAPIVSSKKSPLTRAFVSAIREEGGSPTYKKKLGTSDMNVLGNHWNVPIVAYGPGDSKLDHTPEEGLSLDEYLASIKILRAVLSSLIARESFG